MPYNVKQCFTLVAIFKNSDGRFKGMEMAESDMEGDRGHRGLEKMCHSCCSQLTEWTTVVPVMNGHPRDQAKVSVHCRWPLATGTDGQAGDAKYNTHCNNT